MRRAICYKYVLPTCFIVVLMSGRQAECYSQLSIEKVTKPYGLSEAPHWDVHTQKLYFVDSTYQYIRRLDTATGVVTSAYIGNETVGVVVPVADSTNQFVVGVGKNLVLVTWDGDNDESDVPVEVLCSFDSAQSPTRTNDGKVDSRGRFWIGTMGIEENGRFPLGQGTLYSVDYNLKPKKEISPVSMSNGLAWNSAETILYYSDTATRVIAAYNYNRQNGKISNRIIVFDFGSTDLQGGLDGMTIDTDGNLWIAVFDGYYVIQVNPRTGKVLRKVKMPVKNVTSVAFGGPFLDILYVTTSGYNSTAEQETSDAGAVFAVRGLGVRGIPSHSFVMKAKDY